MRAARRIVACLDRLSNAETWALALALGLLVWTVAFMVTVSILD